MFGAGGGIGDMTGSGGGGASGGAPAPGRVTGAGVDAGAPPSMIGPVGGGAPPNVDAICAM